MSWRQSEATVMCQHIHGFAPRYNAHVALTGGCLYKPDARKDLDILFYRIRQADEIDTAGLFKALKTELDWTWQSGAGWVHKFVDSFGRKVDVFFPEAYKISAEHRYEWVEDDPEYNQ